MLSIKNMPAIRGLKFPPMCKASECRHQGSCGRACCCATIRASAAASTSSADCTASATSTAVSCLYHSQHGGCHNAPVVQGKRVQIAGWLWLSLLLLPFKQRFSNHQQGQSRLRSKCYLHSCQARSVNRCKLIQVSPVQKSPKAKAWHDIAVITQLSNS